MSTKLSQNVEDAATGARVKKTHLPPLNILCVARDRDLLNVASELSAELPTASISTKNITNGHADPLYGIDPLPDLVMYFQGTCWIRELEEFSRRPADIRPPLVLVGQPDNPEALRSALRAGARDIFSEDKTTAELASSLKGLLSTIFADRRSDDGNLVAVINAKGGCGASMLSSNIACHSAQGLGLQTVLVDLDVQFGSPGQYLDIPPQRGLLEALQMAGELDAMALEGYMIRHKSGLHILSTEGQDLYLADDLAGNQLEKLLKLLRSNYQQIIVDLPRHVDLFTSTLLERADRVVVVVQQDISTLRDATRLLRILTVDLNLPRNRIEVVVNRFNASAPIPVKDIENTLACERVTVIPNDFKTVSESLNSAIPVNDIARGKPISRALRCLSESLTGSAPQRPTGMLARLKSLF